MLAPLITAALLGFAPLSPPTTFVQAAPAEVRQEAAEQFIRREVAEDGTITVQTAGKKMSAPGKPDIWLMGVVHIGLPSYYAEIQALLDAQDVVLYEGVKPAKDQPKPVTPPPSEDQEKPAKKTDIYSVFGEVIGLEHQNAHISYKNPKWFNSDLSWDEINAFLPEDTKGGSVTMVQNMMKPDSQESSILTNFLKLPLPGMKEALKVFFVKQLGEPNIQKMGIAGDPEFDRILLLERNKVVERDLSKYLSQDQTPVSIGVIYGAAHQPAFVKHLAENHGYTLSETKWFSAASANPETLDASGKQMLQMLERAGGGIKPDKG